MLIFPPASLLASSAVLTEAVVDRLIADYCRRHSTDGSARSSARRCRPRWNANLRRRHARLRRLAAAEKSCLCPRRPASPPGPGRLFRRPIEFLLPELVVEPQSLATTQSVAPSRRLRRGKRPASPPGSGRLFRRPIEFSARELVAGLQTRYARGPAGLVPGRPDPQISTLKLDYQG
jgi:hypothetical protein